MSTPTPGNIPPRDQKMADFLEKYVIQRKRGQFSLIASIVAFLIAFLVPLGTILSVLVEVGLAIHIWMRLKVEVKDKYYKIGILTSTISAVFGIMLLGGLFLYTLTL